jgi:hypothetical protein
LGFENEKFTEYDLKLRSSLLVLARFSVTKKTASKFAERNEIQPDFNAEQGMAPGFLSRHQELSKKKKQTISV